MNHVEFALHFAEHAEAGFIFAALSVIVNLLLLRRYFYSIFDPLLYFTVLSAMAGSIVLYLYYFKLISPYYFWSYIATQTAFVGAFLLIKPPVTVPSTRPLSRYPKSGTINILYFISVMLFVASQLFVYSRTGLPIFLESRLEVFAEGGGFGFLSRLILVTSTISLCGAFYRLLILERGVISRVFDCSVVAFVIVVAILSGAKGQLLSLIFTVSLALYFARKYYPTQTIERRVRRFFYFIVALAFPAALATIYFQANIEGVGELAVALVMRFFQTGDIFYLVYPNDVLSHLANGNGFLALFYSPLGTLRLVSRDALPVNLGLQAFWYHYDTDLLTGPNARHNVFGLHYFGPYYSVLFSFALGLLFSFTRNTMYRLLPAGPIGMIAYVLLVNCALFIDQDVSGQALDYFFSVLILFPPLYLASLIVHAAQARPFRRSRHFRPSNDVMAGAHEA